jgi:hypothetical protein
VLALLRLCEFYPGICLTTEEKARKNLSQGKKNLSQVKKNLSQSKKNLSQSMDLQQDNTSNTTEVPLFACYYHHHHICVAVTSLLSD